MSLFAKIRGTIETIFQLGLSGPQLKNNGGIIDARNAADSAYAVVRSKLNIVRVSNATYNAVAFDVVVCDTSIGNVVVNLPALNPGEWVTIVQDAATSLAVNTVTINGNGTNILQPAPSVATFAASFVMNTVDQEGAALQWFNGGSANGYLLGA